MPPWLSPLQAALDAGASDPTSRYLQLATMRGDGRPANRTLVFRRFHDDGTLLIAVDARSEKVAELTASPWAEVCWYFRQVREQFRLLCQSELASDDIRRSIWGDLSRDSRAQYGWPRPKQSRSRGEAFAGPSPEGGEPPATFAVLALTATEVDRLELRGVPQNRTLYTRDGEGWRTTAVNP